MLSNRKRKAAAVTAAALGIAILFSVFHTGMASFFRGEAVISVCGDILLDRGVADALEQNGEDYPYGEVSAAFRKDDVTVANLECPLTNQSGGAMKSPRFVFKADPVNAKALKAAGFDVLLLANNHTMDYLSAGLTDTMKALDGAGLSYAGAGVSEEEIRPCFLTKNGVRIGILSYSSLPPEGFVYDGSRATIAYARAGYLDGMKRDIAKAAEQCDFLIVFFHWGTEFTHKVSSLQAEIAHAAVDAGAGAVVGTHPHVLQGKETYRGAPIYYSIGNFVFDSQTEEGTDEAMVLQFTVSKKGIVFTEELPVVIEDCRPQFAQGQEAETIRSDLNLYSSMIQP
jgi:poly-gamma-glutamate synthesis protein (capsule biosynthesis protein)